MTLLMAEMEESMGTKGNPEIQEADPIGGVQDTEDSRAAIEALRSQVGCHLLAETCNQ